jgi:hypothetical protein
VFTCANGASQIPWGFNVRIKGHAVPRVFGSTGTSAANMAVAFSTSQIVGTWYARTSLPAPPASTGIFTGINSDTLDGQFTYSLGTKLTGTPVTVTPAGMTLGLTAGGNRVDGYFYGTDRGIFLPTHGPVFDLPSGCTCNSEEMGVIDNRVVAFGIIEPVPAFGGDDGLTSVAVIGNGFVSGVTVRLRRAGSTDIVGSNPTVYHDGTRISVQFRSSRRDARSLGSRDRTSDRRLGDQARRVRGAGRPAAAARGDGHGTPSGAAQRLFTLHGAGDEPGQHGRGVGAVGTLGAAQFGADAARHPLQYPPPLPGESDWSNYSPQYVQGGVTYLPLFISRVPSGQTVTVSVSVRPTELTEFELHAIAQPPVAGSGAQAAMAKGGNSTLSVEEDCAKAVVSTLLSCLGLPFRAGCVLEVAAGLVGCYMSLSDLGGPPTIPAILSVTMTGLSCGESLTSAAEGCSPVPSSPGIGCLIGFAQSFGLDGGALACCMSAGYCSPPNQDRIRVGVRTSFDPNEKVAGKGLSTQGYIPRTHRSRTTCSSRTRRRRRRPPRPSRSVTSSTRTSIRPRSAGARSTSAAACSKSTRSRRLSSTRSTCARTTTCWWRSTPGSPRTPPSGG